MQSAPLHAVTTQPGLKVPLLKSSDLIGAMSGFEYLELVDTMVVRQVTYFPFFNLLMLYISGLCGWHQQIIFYPKCPRRTGSHSIFLGA